MRVGLAGGLVNNPVASRLFEFPSEVSAYIPVPA